jgi:hypothetical protein
MGRRPNRDGLQLRVATGGEKTGRVKHPWPLTRRVFPCGGLLARDHQLPGRQVVHGTYQVVC